MNRFSVPTVPVIEDVNSLLWNYNELKSILNQLAKAEQAFVRILQ